MAGERQLLAGDIGGTKTLLALYERRGDAWVETQRKRFVSRDYPSLAPIVTELVGDAAGIVAAGFGIAGPIEGRICRATNLPWIIDADELERQVQAPVGLINDFHAAALGVLVLDPQDVTVLQHGDVDPDGPVAIIGAGTGLGEAIIVPAPSGPRVLASEGGHCDFAPRNETEIELLRFMLRRHARVSVERVVSGPGLRAVYDFVTLEGLAPASEDIQQALEHEDPGKVIGEAGLAGSDPACVKALELFIGLYGAEAGNLALKCLPTGGLYVGGGIAPRLIEKLRGTTFLSAFRTKGRMSPLLDAVQVSVVMNSDVGLLGAREHAARLLAGTER